MRLSASRKTFLVSAVAHGLLFALLSPWISLLAGAEAPKVAEVWSNLVTPTELPPEPPANPELLPPPPEAPPPPEFTAEVPPEEALADDPLFDPPAEMEPTSRFEIPRERSIAIRAANRPMREPAPVAAPQPPVRAVAVSAPAPRPIGVSRQPVPLRENAPPRYPAQAAERALQGVVLVEVQLDREGNVIDVQLLRSSGYAILDREALRAVSDWRFRPALQQGVAVSSRLEVPIRFRIG